MAHVTHRFQVALQQAEALEQRLDRLTASPAGAAELTGVLGRLGEAWAEAHTAAVEACQTDQPIGFREPRRLRVTTARAKIR